MSTKPQTRDEVLADIRAARGELEAALGSLSEEQLTQPLNDGGWTIKDHLAHIADWQRRGIAVIRGNPPYVGLGIDKETWERRRNIDDVNEILYQRHRDRSLTDVLQDFRTTQQQVEALIEEMSDEDLRRELPEDISPKYRQVIDLANSNFAGHDREHIDDIRGLANEH